MRGDVHVRSGLEAVERRKPLALASGTLPHSRVKEPVERLGCLEARALLPRAPERPFDDARDSDGLVELRVRLLNECRIAVAEGPLQRLLVSAADPGDDLLIEGGQRLRHCGL